MNEKQLMAYLQALLGGFSDRNAPHAKLIQRVLAGQKLTPQESQGLVAYITALKGEAPANLASLITEPTVTTAAGTPSLAQRALAAAQAAAQGRGQSAENDNGIGGGGPEGNAATARVAAPGAASSVSYPSSAPIVRGAPNQLAGGGGISSAEDNGIGGGGPQGAAAVTAAVAQQAAAAKQTQAAAQQQSAPLPGGFNSAQGNALSKDDDLLLSFALRAAGFDPNHVTRYSKLAAQALLPLLQSRRNAYGLSGGEGGALANVGGLPQDIAQFAKDFTTKGMDFYGNAQRYAQQAMNGETFKNSIAGLADQEQVAAMYQSMMPLLYAGSNPLVQQAAGDTFRRQMENFNYRDAGFDLPGTPASNGVLMDWLGSQQNVDPITRRIFGLK